ncbi:MAG: PBSX family phage terminase large subunit [Ruminococcus sp.]|jgi:PBSX family phage terminase large subunit|nr:PBSX family phage terminase large subunit [Ruminococcus sp.]
MMTFEKLSAKQRLIMSWAYGGKYRGIIADGAVRTGKTVCMAAAFILWAMKSFSGMNFAVCGKTIRSAERNIIAPLRDMADIAKYFRIRYKKNDNCLTITEKKSRRQNRFYIFGGRDETSYMLIQGITLAGVMFDEAALMPESFIEQACARTISVEDSKLWFNCNPGSKHSYFYENWICKAKEKNLLRVTLLLPDNPILSKKQIEEAQSMYSGVFRERYILGRWVEAEGLVYPAFAENPERFSLHSESGIIFGSIGLDFGGNGSAHAAVLVGFTKNFGKIAVLDEYYRKEIITPTALERDITAFVSNAPKMPLNGLYCDSAEQVLIKGIKNALAAKRIPIEVKNARKSAVNDRIAFLTVIMDKGRFFISDKCSRLKDALCSAVWGKNGERLDNGSVNIDSLDALEYALEPFMKQIL